MKTKNLVYIYLVCLLILSEAACKKQVKVDPPITSVSTTTVFSNDNTAISAQLNLYASMANDPYTYHYYSGLSSDEYTNFSTNVNTIALYKNSLNAQANARLLFWSTTYNYLFRVNSVLEGIANSTGMSDKVKQQTKGEALFMRAYFLFYLTNFYGDVVITKSSDYKVNSALPRSPQPLVYQEVIKDLQQAQALLSANYLDATDQTVTIDRVRPTKWAATALLARAYLYNKNWSQADSASSALIGNSTFQLSPLTGGASVFMKNSSEAIWQLTPNLSENSFATSDGLYSILTAAPSVVYGFTISPQLISAFEPNDQRKIFWIGAYNQGATTYLYPAKYKDGSQSTSLREYTMMLRLGEQYLIRAEARANNNNPNGAVADLNVIRNRAGLPNYSGLTDMVSLSTAILHERQVELFSEGHRWFDLRRSGRLDAVMGPPGNVTISKGGLAWNSFQQYYPIPLSDINVSPNLVQTPGY